MFQFRRFPTYGYLIHRKLTGSSPAGLPHSEIHGSKPICGSPWLIAACHVLLRLLMPRHPPCALVRLTFRYPCGQLYCQLQSSCPRILQAPLTEVFCDIADYPLKGSSTNCFANFSVASLFSFLHLFSSQGANSGFVETG